MLKEIKENYLTKENGCRILQVSSEREGSLATNILTDNQRQLWVFQKKLPQYCIIDTSNLRSFPKVFNRVGFYCWHQYESNPALIEIAYNNRSSDEWIVAGKIRLPLKSQRQYFKIKDIPTTEMKQLKITILQNYGDKSTYLNQIELGFVKEVSPLEPTRDKTFSDFMKLTSTEKELKRAQQQIRKLTTQNEEIKHTVKKQGEMIIQMQMAFKTLTKEMEKLHKIQQLQTQKYMVQQNSTAKQANKIIQRKKNKLNTNTHSSQSESQSKKEQRRYIEDRIMNKKAFDKKNTSQSYTKSNINSHKKQHTFEDIRNSKGTTIRQSKNKMHKDTQSELSEYSMSEHDDKASKYSQKCSQMMVKLQILLAERQRREKQLKKKSQRSNS